MIVFCQVLSSSEKAKPKAAVRNAETNVAVKIGPQQPSLMHSANQSIRHGNTKSDVPKTSGKFTDLKSVVWENGVSPASKDVPSPTISTNSRAGNQLTVVSAVASTPVRNPNNIKSPTERKPGSLDLKLGSSMDKKPSLSHVQSRNDFFNLIKKKTSMNSSTVLPESGPVVSSPTMETSSEVTMEVVSPHASSQGHGNGRALTSNGDAREDAHRRPDSEAKDSISNATVYPDEEEAAFLRSLGWEENTGEDEGLTEEEINAFIQEVSYSCTL